MAKWQETVPIEKPAASEEEVAAYLSESEGRPVSVLEIRRIEYQALRKMRKEIIRRGFSFETLSPT